MRFLAINNLASGYGDGLIYDFIRSLVQDGDEVVLRSTDGSTDLRSFLTDASEFDAVIASGGDGTIATVSYLLANTGIPILPLPSGTANLLTQNLASPNEPHALAKQLRAGLMLDFDLGELDIEGDCYGFAIMSGTGYDAAIMEEAEPNKKLWGVMAYFGAAVTMIGSKPSRFTLTLDGQTVETDGLGILIMNFSKIQFDLSIAHNNRPRDGWFDIAVLKTDTPLGLLPVVHAAALDALAENPDRTEQMQFFRAKEVRVEADPPMKIEYDGEVAHRNTPFTARILPKAARFIVSEEGYEIFNRDEA